MKKRFFFLFIVFFSVNLALHSQSNDFLNEFEALIDNEKVQLIPDKMIFSQKLIWGERGLLRKTGISKLSIENREKELILREKMLKAHQIIGYVTFAAMIAQGIIGGKLYNGENDLYNTHKDLGNFVTASYFVGASLSLLAPPPLVSKEIKDKKILDKEVQNKDFYFIHSYMAVTEKKENTFAYCKYFDVNIPAIIKKDNIIGCQFHPEKSGRNGLNFLKKIISLD